MVKVSIIVPVYNVQKYLHKSVESLINQTLKEIEIILVNDGSSDNSLWICEDYAKKDERIKVINQPNGGVSVARNAGLKLATGKYIAFMDPDDWVEAVMYEKMYLKAEQTGTQVVMCNYIMEELDKRTPVLLPTVKEILQKSDILDWLIPNILAAPKLRASEGIMGSVWRLLIKRECIKQNEILFPIGVGFTEDVVFCIKLFLNVQSIAISRDVYYHYRINQNSAVTRYTYNIDEMQLQVFNQLKTILENKQVYELLKERMDLRYINMKITSLVNEVHPACSKKTLEKIKAMNKLCQDKDLKVILKNTNIKGYTFRKKLVLKAMKHGVILYLYMYFKLFIKIKK